MGGAVDDGGYEFVHGRGQAAGDALTTGKALVGLADGDYGSVIGGLVAVVAVALRSIFPSRSPR